MMTFSGNLHAARWRWQEREFLAVVESTHSRCLVKEKSACDNIDAVYCVPVMETGR